MHDTGETISVLVRYFDLGAHKGGEIARMRKLLAAEPLVSSYSIHGFEAHPALARRMRLTYLFNKNIHIAQYALGSNEGERTLFLNRNLVGSSVYQGKNNIIPGREVRVPCRRLSEYLNSELPEDWVEDFNIIKSNIEGAEWEVWHDLLENNLVRHFNLWLGPGEGYGSWAEDFKKIKGMEDKAEIMRQSFERESVYVYRFSSFDKKIPNSDIKTILHTTLASVADPAATDPD